MEPSRIDCPSLSTLVVDGKDEEGQTFTNGRGFGGNERRDGVSQAQEGKWHQNGDRVRGQPLLEIQGFSRLYTGLGWCPKYWCGSFFGWIFHWLSNKCDIILVPSAGSVRNDLSRGKLDSGAVCEWMGASKKVRTHRAASQQQASGTVMKSAQLHTFGWRSCCMTQAFDGTGISKCNQLCHDIGRFKHCIAVTNVRDVSVNGQYRSTSLHGRSDTLGRRGWEYGWKEQNLQTHAHSIQKKIHTRRQWSERAVASCPCQI